MEKRKAGRPPGRPVGKAIEAASVINASLTDMQTEVDKMKGHQRAMFESLMSGEDELIAILRAKKEEYFTGITKMVDQKDGGRLLTSQVTLENIDTLTPDSYERLRSICASKVRVFTGTTDYREYTDSVREYIKRYAPLALGTIVRLSQDAKKEEVQLKASKDILDRAGEREPEGKHEMIVPIQVNIMLTGEDGKTFEYKA